VAHQPQFRWIILVNKSPRGPLTETEVRALLAQGVVRHNDLAYRVDAEDPKEKSDWKLLWQFEEFDRRAPDPFNKKKVEKTEPTAAKPVEERRVKLTDEELRQQGLEQLPADLMDIAPEELIPRSRAMSAAAEEARWAEMTEEAQASSARRGGGFEVPAWLYGLITAVLLSFGFFRWLSGRPSSPAVSTPATPPEHADLERPAERANPGAHARSMPHMPVRSDTTAVPTERPSDPFDNVDRDKERDYELDREREAEERAAEAEREREAKEAREPGTAEPRGEDPSFEETRKPAERSKVKLGGKRENGNEESNGTIEEPGANDLRDERSERPEGNE
jgi:hypothetical protein